jgi:hypothetical protein
MALSNIIAVSLKTILEAPFDDSTESKRGASLFFEMKCRGRRGR